VADRDGESHVTTSVDPAVMADERALAPRVVITAEPENSEFPFAELRSWLTPVEQFYVRNHFAIPELDPAAWRLRVGERSFSLLDLAALPQRSVFATLECAGNGRSFCVPPVQGVQWRTGAVSNGEWHGPALKDVLATAEISDETAHVHLTGADRGELRGRETDYARSLPRAKALHPDTLVALGLNGEPLTPDHGAPARVVVPGWYGMASVKWLIAIDPADEPSANPFMVEEYTRSRRQGGREPLDWMEPKAQIARPVAGATVPSGTIDVVGAAWSGTGPIERVEVSVDGGRRWRATELEGPGAQWSWRLWRWGWDAKTGEHELRARAIDARGNTQPDRPDPTAPGYLNHWIRPHPVRVV
jgi:DMSO/TMAO reductase YedYZ molybdopterin-dependent catalytic subunit